MLQKIYLIIGYYNILLTDGANKIFMITTLFVNIKYNRLAMVVCIAPDIFQDQMNSMMDGLEFVRVYLDNFLIITSGSLEEHLDKVEEVMK